MLCYAVNSLLRNKSTCLLNFKFFLIERSQLQTSGSQSMIYKHHHHHRLRNY